MQQLIVTLFATSLVFGLVGCSGESGSDASADAMEIERGAPLFSEPVAGEGDIDSASPVAANATGSDADPTAGLRPVPGSKGEFKEVEEKEGEGIVTFRLLSSFKYVEPDPGKPETAKKDQIPEKIETLDGTKVTMEGYMIPIDLDADTNRVKTFFLARNTLACCFGQLPEANEVVEVRFAEGVKFLPDILLRVEGTFEVGEEFDEYGYLMSIYRIAGDKIEDPWDQ
ncbi:MAG: DUF3299 domain-containing protein [Planctomycetota bacterium]